MKVSNGENTTIENIGQIESMLPDAENLLQLIAWANTRPKSDFIPEIVAEVIVQDEFTHDVIIPFQDVFLVFDTT